MKNHVAKAAALILVLAASSAMAVPAGKSVEWQTSNGKVVFSGDVHAKKGFKCADCHSKIFKMKKGADPIKMSDIYAGKYCGECHNGKKAFKAMGNCAKCHKK
ncbi:hypothetical protein GMSM_15830 [Geomonas sp. Red276]